MRKLKEIKNIDKITQWKQIDLLDFTGEYFTFCCLKSQNGGA